MIINLIGFGSDSAYSGGGAYGGQGGGSTKMQGFGSDQASKMQGLKTNKIHWSQHRILQQIVRIYKIVQNVSY